jgi:serine/threonine protein kinase
MLSKHSNIVQFMDTIVQNEKLFILMEYCQGSILDCLNSTNLTYRAILNIFVDVCRGTSWIHSMGVIHRDLKVENVLVVNGIWKICDFGSCSTTFYDSTITLDEIRNLEHEISACTTLQYRAPEICNLYLKKKIDTMIDIWALGVLLYKMCYLTTPFENGGILAILNAQYTIPATPAYPSSVTDIFSIFT